MYLCNCLIGFGNIPYSKLKSLSEESSESFKNINNNELSISLPTDYGSIKKELWQRTWYVVPNHIIKIIGLGFGIWQGIVIMRDASIIYKEETSLKLPSHYKAFTFAVPLCVYYYAFNVIAQFLGYVISLIANHCRNKTNYWTRPVYDFIHYTSIVAGIVFGSYEGNTIQNDISKIFNNLFNKDLPWCYQSLVFSISFLTCCYILKIAGHHLGFYINLLIEYFRKKKHF